MNWFKKKDEEGKNEKEKQLKELKDFAEVGEDFTYLGVKVTIVEFILGYKGDYFDYSSKMVVNYVDSNKIIQSIHFYHSDLPLLRIEKAKDIN